MVASGCNMPKGFPLTEEDLSRVRHNIIDASVSLFLEKGFQETSMQEIARAAGMGKSTLYDYFPNKDEVLLAYVEDVFMGLEQRVQKINVQEIPSVEKLRKVMHLHLEYLLEKKELYIRLTFEIQRLGLESQRRIQAKRHAYQDLLCGLIASAVEEGAFRPVNVLLAARTIIALLTPVAYTTRPTGTPDEMLDEVLDIFYHGVIKLPEE